MPFVTELVETEIESARFEQRESLGPYAMAVVIDNSRPGVLIYAWWRAMAGEDPVEQSQATVSLSPPQDR